MIINEIQTVQLNEEEQPLHDAVFADRGRFLEKDHDTQIDILEKMGHLTESLLDRDAIPKVRVAYFTDPKMNVGGRGKSHKKVFEGNGNSCKEILRHGGFMEYLWYFIHGPNLPKDTIRGFCKVIAADSGTSGMVLKQIRAYVRQQVRDKGLPPGDAAEEFFKLAHEIGKPSVAESVRSAAMSAKR